MAEGWIVQLDGKRSNSEKGHHDMTHLLCYLEFSSEPGDLYMTARVTSTCFVVTTIFPSL